MSADERPRRNHDQRAGGSRPAGPFLGSRWPTRRGLLGELPRPSWWRRRDHRRPCVHRSVDALRLILAVAVLVGAQLLAAVAHVGVRTSERALLGSVVTLPPTLRDVLTGAAQLVLVLLPPAVAVAMAVGRRFARVGRMLLAGGVGLALGAVDSHLLLGHSHPEVWRELLAGRSGVFAITFPPVAEVAKSPHQVALIVVGALGGPLVQVVAFSLCVHALGGQLPVVQLAAVYLGGHLVASAAPVPGGLAP